MTYLEKIKELLPKVRTDIITGYCPTIYFGLEVCGHVHGCKANVCWEQEFKEERKKQNESRKSI